MTEQAHPTAVQEKKQVLRVLVVDDDPNVIEGLRRALWKQPLEFLSAADAKEGLALLACMRVDAVVSDEQMPGMSGSEFLRKVRSLHPGAIRFMLSGTATLETAVNAVNRAGISKLFLKPANPVEICTAIREEFERAKAASADKPRREEDKRPARILLLPE
jgi:DNA-binding NtrC family response regulator